MTPRTPARPGIPWEARMPSRQGVLFAVRARYSTRVHMGLIVLGSMGVALLVTKGLLAAGLDSMFWRYLTATFAAYTAFFVGVWMWLHLSSYGRHLRARRDPREHAFDAPADLPLPDVSFTPSSPAADGFAGDGGSFDGGGASASWGDAGDGGAALEAAGGLAADEGGVLLAIAMGLVIVALVTLFGAVALVVWEAPVILAEVIFEVLLASALIRGVRGVGSRDWSLTLLRRTWKSFAFVCALALGFAIVAGEIAPHARTAPEVVRTVTGK